MHVAALDERITLADKAKAGTAAWRQTLGSRRAAYTGGAVVVLLACLFAFTKDRPGVVAQAAPPGKTVSAPVTRADSAAAAEQASRAAIRASRVARPEVVRGLYLNAWAAGSPRKLEKLLKIADETEVNAFVIDVKEAGFVSYKTKVPLARKIGADSAFIRNIGKVLDKVKARGIYSIARIVVFKDPVLARAKPDWAIQKKDGSLWQDDKGTSWVDSYNKQVWDYNIAIAREAIELGFSEVQWDYVRFPDVPPSFRKTQVYPAQKGRAKQAAIREFLLYSREQLADLDVQVTADVFGLTVSSKDDMNIGQQWEQMLDATDVLLPMVYPSHFARGSYGIGHPNAKPYETVKTAMAWATKRSAGVPNAATIRPWLQDFTLGPPRYTETQVRAQKKAVYDAGLTEWVMWNPGSNYTVSALDADSVAMKKADYSRKAPAIDSPDAPELLGKPTNENVQRP